MNRRLQILLAIFLITSTLLFSQTNSNFQQSISVNTDGSVPDGSAILDVQSITQGVLVPRMTMAQRTAINPVAVGLLVFDTDTGSFWFYDGSAWVDLSGQLADGDDDTKIQVEESNDEDVIRFDVGGSEFAAMDGKTFKLQAPGENIFIGTSTGASNTTGQSNFFAGHNAGFQNTEGSLNTFLGAFAGHNNTTVSGNTFVGQGTGFTNSSGAANTFIGNNAGNLNQTAGSNTFVGADAGKSNTVGKENTFIGTRAGFANLDGEFNTFIGKDAGATNTEGDNNTFMGYFAGVTNSSGSGNTFIGREAGSQNTIGTGNAFLGDGAGFNNTEGVDNTLIGKGAGQSNTIGSNNVILGKNAGFNNAGSSNVFIGHSAGMDETGSNLLFIENSNSATPLIWGDFSADLVGINRVAMTNTLEVGGNASKASAGDWLANSDARLKTNIEPLKSEEMLQRLLMLQGITYEWDDDKTGNKRPAGLHYGFTAQNIQEVFPTLVEEDALGYLQTAYGTYDAMTVEAIRSLNGKVENLEDENAKLKDRLARLEAVVLQKTEGKFEGESVGEE